VGSKGVPHRCEDETWIIVTLQKELENVTNILNNYTMQMQTLINQKAIEVPGVKKPCGDFSKFGYNYTREQKRKC
jgi:hypothetical protein